MARFQQLAQLAEQMAAEPSKLKKRAAIAEALAAVHAAGAESDASPRSAGASLFALYLAGTPFAEADPRKLNAGGALLTRALLAVSGATQAELTAAYRRHGDLGAAAFDLFEAATSTEVSQASPGAPGPSASLTLAEVADTFAALAAARTTAHRTALVETLLRRATPLEAKYLIKLMLGDMRIGVKQSLIEEAIAVAASTAEHPVTPAQVRHAVMLEADLASAVARAFAGTLAEARMRLFHPLGFMLASPVDAPEEAIARFTPAPSQEANGNGFMPPEPLPDGPDPIRVPPRKSVAGLVASSPGIQAFLEDKYDGMRAQLHCGDPAHPGRVALYSRNREEITESFPELAEAFAPVDTPLILDGEILGWDFAAEAPGRALPFAVLSQRIGRKRVSAEDRARIPAIFMAFDLLYANGTLTLELPLHARRSQLEAIAERLAPIAVSPLDPPRKDDAQSSLFPRTTENGERTTPLPRLMLSPARLVESAGEIDRAYAAARARSNEGVMIKAADSVYQPGRRGLAWVKLKRELATLDVVITGTEYGHGKRAGLLSDYTFAVRGIEEQSSRAPAELLNVGKAYSGLTDAEIAELTEFLKAHTLEDQGHFRTVEPLVVLEVAFNNIMRSTRHASGFALRFPRILRLRPDKPLSEIDTLARVDEIYQSQVDKPVEGKC
jgi:DNA ligase-1